jgi:hypothetical protein
MFECSSRSTLGKWKLIAKGHSFKPCDGAVSYQTLGAGHKFNSRLIRVRSVVEKWHWDGFYPVSVIPLMVHTDLHLGNTLARKTRR